jgi:hypothetical protein
LQARSHGILQDAVDGFFAFDSFLTAVFASWRSGSQILESKMHSSAAAG